MTGQETQKRQLAETTWRAIGREMRQVMDEIQALQVRQTILGIMQEAIHHDEQNARIYKKYVDGHITAHEMVQMLANVPDDKRCLLAVSLLEQSEAKANK